MAAAPAIQLHVLPEGLDRDGQPRVALVLPAEGGGRTRRAVTLLFPTIAAAVAAKRHMEGVANARQP